MFLAVALPVLAALLASLSSVDLAYHLRAGEEIVRTARSRASTRGPSLRTGCRGSTSSGDRRSSFGGLPDRWLDGSGPASSGARGGHLRSVALRRAPTRPVAAERRAGDPRRIRGRGPGPGASSAVAGHGLLRDPAGPRRRIGAAIRPVLWAIPVLVLVWANLHGSFFLAPVVLGLAWLEDVAERRPGAHRTLLIASCSVAAACVTPFGPAVWGYAVGLSTNPEVTSRITEWQPTTIRDGTGVLFFISAAAVVSLMARRGRPVPWPTLAWIGMFAVIGLYAQRGLAWWSLAGAVAVIGLLPRSSDAPEPRDAADLAASQRRRGGRPGARRDRPASARGARPTPVPAFRSAS